MKRFIFIGYIFLASVVTAFFTLNPAISAQEQFNWWILHAFYHAAVACVVWIMSQINTEDLKLPWRYIIAIVLFVLTEAAHIVLDLTGQRSIPYIDWIMLPSIGSYVIVAMFVSVGIGILGAGLIVAGLILGKID